MSWRSKTFDELPALAVRGEELRRSLRQANVAWMYGVVWMSCTIGSHVPVFSKMLGFTNWDFGVLAAVPFLGTIAQLASSIQIERTGLRKYQFLFFNTAHRALWIAVAAIPIIFWMGGWGLPSRVAVWSFILILLASNLCNAVAAPAWWTWMGDLIPKRLRGRYFASRALYGRPIQFVVAIALGLITDYVTRAGPGVADDSAADQPKLLWTMCVIFAVAGFFGVIEILCFARIRELLPSISRPRPPAYSLEHLGPSPAGLGGRLVYGGRAAGSMFRQMLMDPLKDRVFRHYVGYGATIQFAMTLPGYFFWRNGMENLGFSKLAMNLLFLVISPILGLLGAQWWGKVIDRWGRRPVLFISTFLVMISATPWFIAHRGMGNPPWFMDAANWLFAAAGRLVGRPDWFALAPDMPVGAYLTVVCSTLFGGIGWTGIMLAQNAVVLGFSDGHGRSKYVAASAVLIAVGGVLGGVTGGFVARRLEDFAYNAHPLVVGPFEWNNWHATFALSILFRFLSLLWLVRMPDPGSRHVRDLIRSMGGGLSTTVSGWLLYPLRILGWSRVERKTRRRGDTETRREEKQE